MYPHWTENQSTSSPPGTRQNTYRHLMELRCVTTLERCRVYQNYGDYHKICGTCHAKLPFGQEPAYGCIVPHNLVHKNSIESGTNCTFCERQLVNVRPADECRGCIEEFQRTNIVRLYEGRGVQVVPTWING